MPRAVAQEVLDLWEQRESLVYQYVPYATLTVSLLLTLLIGTPPTATLYEVFGLTAAATLWALWLVTLHPEWEEERRVLMGLYFVGLLVLMFELVIRAPWYGLFCFTGYLQAVQVLRGRWRVVGVLATAVMVATSQDGGLPSSGMTAVVGYVVIIGFNLLIGGMMSWFGWVTQEQSSRRKRSNDELADANRRLAATLEENRGLHALLLNQAREAGVLDERQRLAQEIHDTLAQGLIGIITQLQAAEQARVRAAAPPAAGEERRHLDVAARLARESLTEARRSVMALQPEPLESAADLSQAVAEVAARWSAVHTVTVQVHTTGTARRLHPEVEATVLRTAQEALANVAKHARATRVGLTLSYMEDQITLDVRDDGVGFEVRADGAAASGTASGPVAGGGFGLTAMRQRVQRLAGRLEIESEPGGGTAISASLPAVAAAGEIGAGGAGGGTSGTGGGASGTGRAGEMGGAVGSAVGGAVGTVGAAESDSAAGLPGQAGAGDATGPLSAGVRQ